MQKVLLLHRLRAGVEIRHETQRAGVAKVGCAHQTAQCDDARMRVHRQPRTQRSVKRLERERIDREGAWVEKRKKKKKKKKKKNQIKYLSGDSGLNKEYVLAFHIGTESRHAVS